MKTGSPPGSWSIGQGGLELANLLMAWVQALKVILALVPEQALIPDSLVNRHQL